ncbi:MAG: efflux transporter periplasmic adaptor subunit, partial [Paracoccaceae bacterium]|nr:efflux transporter periplasmic adaptor subunit [Paracoccaceae bacterium]
MRFFRRALVGLFLLAVTLGLLAMAAQTIRGAIEARLADSRPAMPARERVFSANLLAVEPATLTPVMTAFG